MTAAVGLVTTGGAGPPNTVAQIQPGMNVQPVVLVNSAGSFVTPLTVPVPVNEGGTGQSSLASYALLAGGTSSTANVQQVPSSGIAGLALTDGGSAALPSFGTLGVGGGGTGGSSLTTYALLAGGTASASAVQQVGTGTSGQALISGGSAALPSFGTLGVTGGGTGQITAAAAYNALSPMTTRGDMEYDSANATAARLGIGTPSQVLIVSGGTLPAWGTAAVAGGGTGQSSLTAYALLAGGTATTTPVQQIAVGTSGQVLTSNGAGALPTMQGNPALVYASSVLGSAAASITFSSIPAGYNLLRLLVIGASAAAQESDRWAVAVNGDSGAHYDLQAVYGANTSTTSQPRNAVNYWFTGGSTPDGDMPAASATAGVAGILEIQIPAYAGTTFQKTGLWASGYTDAATSASDQVSSRAVIAWRSSAAITSVTIATVSGSNLIAATTALLYLL